MEAPKSSLVSPPAVLEALALTDAPARLNSLPNVLLPEVAVPGYTSIQEVSLSSLARETGTSEEDTGGRPGSETDARLWAQGVRLR